MAFQKFAGVSLFGNLSLVTPNPSRFPFGHFKATSGVLSYSKMAACGDEKLGVLFYVYVKAPIIDSELIRPVASQFLFAMCFFIPLALARSASASYSSTEFSFCNQEVVL